MLAVVLACLRITSPAVPQDPPLRAVAGRVLDRPGACSAKRTLAGDVEGPPAEVALRFDPR